MVPKRSGKNIFVETMGQISSLKSDETNLDPLNLPSEDRGDDVARRFRYQHAYGVILLIDAANKKLPYTSIMCEYHDDFLAVDTSSKYHSFQVKTRIPEYGHWETNDREFVDALKKFAKLDSASPGKFSRFKFVSNAKTSNSTARSKVGNRRTTS